MKRIQREFNSFLAPYFERFVTIRRAGGALFESEELRLLRFDRYLAQKAPTAPLDRETVLGFLATYAHISARARDNLSSTVWQAATYASRHGASVEPLPARPPPAPPDYRLRAIRTLSIEEFRSVLSATAHLPPAGGLRSATAAALFSLLFVTGMRIGEALALNVDDLDERDHLLTIRRGKFGKARVLPIRASTVDALRRYAADSRRGNGHAAPEPLFVSCRHRRISHPAVLQTFHEACREAGVDKPHLPRLHDLRHSFAVHRVSTWYAAGCDVNAMLPSLSTYLGHVSVENTRLYLVANGRLLQDASARFEAYTATLDQVTP